MKKIFAVLFVCLFLHGCGEQSTIPVSTAPKTNVILSYKYQSPNNTSFGVDEVEIEGERYLILQEGGRATFMMLKPPSKPEKE